jgi:hypothetical protein
MNLKNGKMFTSKFVGTGPSSYEKRIYRAAVSHRLRNTAVMHSTSVKTPVCSRSQGLFHVSWRVSGKFGYSLDSWRRIISSMKLTTVIRTLARCQKCKYSINSLIRTLVIRIGLALRVNLSRILQN